MAGVTEGPAYRVMAAFALAVVVMDVDGVLQVRQGAGDLVHGVHHDVKHVLAVLECISLAPRHVLHTQTHTTYTHLPFNLVLLPF